MEDIIAKFIKQLPFYHQLKNHEIELIERHSSLKTLSSSLHLDKDNCLGFMMLLEGQVKVYNLSKDGKIQTLYRLLPNECCLFSASCVLNAIRFDLHLLPEKETKFLLIQAETYKKLMTQSLAVSNFTNELMAKRFSQVMWLMDQVLNTKLDERLATFLIQEHQLQESNPLKLTHEEIASHIGSVREVVSRLLKYFQEERMIALKRGEVKVLNWQALYKLAKLEK